MVQEDFVNSGGTTLEKLDEYIAQCDGVVHLIGDATGSVAEATEVECLLRRHPDILRRLKLDLELEGGVPEFSYTQWEAYLGIYHRRKVFIYRASSEAPRDASFVRDEDEIQRQQQHYQRIRRLGRDCGGLQDRQGLCITVLRDLADIVRAPDTAPRRPVRVLTLGLPAVLIAFSLIAVIDRRPRLKPITNVAGTATKKLDPTELPDQKTPAPAFADENARIREIESLTERLVPLFDRVQSTQEDEQTFDSYRHDVRTGDVELPRSVYLWPFPERGRKFSESRKEICDQLEEFFPAFFGVKLTRNKWPDVDIDELTEYQGPDETQARVEAIRKKVEETKHYRSVSLSSAVLAVTTRDLGKAGLNFRAAWSDNRRLSVFSLARLPEPISPKDPNYQACQLGVFELSAYCFVRMLGIESCNKFICGLNEHDNQNYYWMQESLRRIQESRRTPGLLRPDFCPDCSKKIWWALHINPRERYPKLIEFATGLRMKRDEEFWSDERDAIGTPVPSLLRPVTEK
jgi:hypothetical protein